MHPLSMKVVLLTLSFVSAAAYIICTLFYVVAPQVTLAFFAAMFHGLDLSMIARTGPTKESERESLEGISKVFTRWGPIMTFSISFPLA